MVYPILLVEDDSKIARVVQIYLEEAGFKVVRFGKGKEAIQHALKEAPILVVLPDMSGEEVCQELNDWRSVPLRLGGIIVGSEGDECLFRSRNGSHPIQPWEDNNDRRSGESRSTNQGCPFLFWTEGDGLLGLLIL